MHSDTWHILAVGSVCIAKHGALHRIKDALWVSGNCNLGVGTLGAMNLSAADSRQQLLYNSCMRTWENETRPLVLQLMAHSWGADRLLYCVFAIRQQQSFFPMHLKLRTDLHYALSGFLWLLETCGFLSFPTIPRTWPLRCNNLLWKWSETVVAVTPLTGSFYLSKIL